VALNVTFYFFVHAEKVDSIDHVYDLYSGGNGFESG
jgi:hypothetical protein